IIIIMRGFYRGLCAPLLVAALFQAAVMSRAMAEGLPPVTGPVVLAIHGAISRTNAKNEADFDLAMLESLPRAVVSTTTAWTNGPQSFEGVSLADLMHFVGAQAGTLKASALNDYTVEIPQSDLSDAHVIVAYRQNGQYMSVADKGPLWIIYPNSIESK